MNDAHDGVMCAVWHDIGRARLSPHAPSVGAAAAAAAAAATSRVRHAACAKAGSPETDVDLIRAKVPS